MKNITRKLNSHQCDRHKVKRVLNQVRKTYNLENQVLTIRDFYRICKGEKVHVFRAKELVSEIGFYMHYKNEKFIYLNPELEGKELEIVAFHELGHHFMHQAGLMPHFYDGEENPTSESEADYFAVIAMEVK